ncbi:hypothetical protein [Blastococcus brunescens]|uniref:Uncharacterized protein n=1 Tax=Blastococcus brunescens TaxID=1564165 RepID=A0ABZ1B0T5_9ACTN|nr:hypothetical protein [Blastococcus sp. BMG 8361]WRL64423.1 hypothetical protein U6N30_00775 [Blastococcus sp. BMG 8361]
MSSVLGGPVGTPVLEVDDLAVTFERKGEKATRAVDGVSFSVAAGRRSAWSGSPAAASP